MDAKELKTLIGLAQKMLAEQGEPVDETAPADAPKKRGRPQGSKNRSSVGNTVSEDMQAKRAALLAEMKAPISAAETKKLIAEAKAAAAKVRDPQLVVDDAVNEVIKPNWANGPASDGYRHFLVKADRKGERVSFEMDRWKTALRSAGLPVSEITFKPEGLGMTQTGTTAISGNVWRVIIG